jgi:hypothetical protein
MACPGVMPACSNSRGPECTMPLICTSGDVSDNLEDACSETIRATFV